jgi:MYXO-CTERM domain-containing protein
MRFVVPALALAVATPALASGLDLVGDNLDSLDPRFTERYGPLLEMSLERPIATYLEVEPEQANTVPMFAPGGAALPIYLNRFGGTYTSGNDDSGNNVSSIVSGGSATIGSFYGDDEDWSDVLGCVQDQFAAFNVYVTDIEPLEGDYVEAVVGGSPQQLGMPWGVGGVAPYDPYGCQVISDAVVYIFSDIYQGMSNANRAVCETVAQEVAHAFTLDHQLLCEDPMTYLDGCGAKTFQDEYSSCGEWEVRECSCNRPSQNSVQLMYELLGTNDGTPPPAPPEDNSAPEVVILSPADGAALIGNDVVTITADAKDDVGLVSVQLEWDFTGDVVPCPGEGGGWSCTVNGSEHTWTVQVGLGTRTFRIKARDVVGKTTVTDDVSLWFSEDGSPRPDDNYPPEVRIVSPREGSVFPANETIEIVATASDDTGISRVELVWEYSDDAWPCPFENRYVTCEDLGSTYIWHVDVGTGFRAFQVRATDLVGNVATTPERTVQLSGNVTGLPPLQNDTWDLAEPLQCGDSVRLVAEVGEEDWFSLPEVADDQVVQVTVSGDASDDLQVTATTGPHSSDLFADAEGAPALIVSPPDEEDVRVRVRPYSADGEYTLEVECLDDPTENTVPEPPAASCSSSGDADTSPPTPALALLLLLGVVGLRRKSRR